MKTVESEYSCFYQPDYDTTSGYVTIPEKDIKIHCSCLHIIADEIDSLLADELDFSVTFIKENKKGDKACA